MIKLRDYQQTCINKAIFFITHNTNDNKLIFELPTGAGKSVIIAHIARQYPSCDIITTRNILVSQFKTQYNLNNVYTINKYHRMLKDGYQIKDILIIDEVHHCINSNKMYSLLLNKYQSSKIIGFTATAFRHGKTNKEFLKLFNTNWYT